VRRASAESRRAKLRAKPAPDLEGTVTGELCLINEVKGINRMVYDISSKPPGTIEWE